jgi:hypothetical protein
MTASPTDTQLMANINNTNNTFTHIHSGPLAKAPIGKVSKETKTQKQNKKHKHTAVILK